MEKRIFDNLPFNHEISIDDWNKLINTKLKKYFSNEMVFEKNKEILRTEIINYIKFCTKPEYLKLFDWTFNLYKDCLNIDKQKIIKVLADSFNEISNTDMKWMINFLTQPDYKKFSDRDKISYYFKVIDRY
ncbi:hypothetical protein [Sedimentibacter sp. zth1]|uniref:hypothetical protein n=1 Tax=Sedimentibacter sp. zth1 TaxID=2816908 RepID=UPI001F5FE1A3|nr:hypothetical protein [Sedimentibacter sp. zth1]